MDVPASAQTSVTSYMNPHIEPPSSRVIRNTSVPFDWVSWYRDPLNIRNVNPPICLPGEIATFLEMITRGTTPLFLIDSFISRHMRVFFEDSFWSERLRAAYNVLIWRDIEYKRGCP